MESKNRFQIAVVIDNSKEPKVKVKMPGIRQLNNFNKENNNLSITAFSELSGMQVRIDCHFTIHSLLM